MRIGSLSPRTTVPNQMLASSSRITWPTTTAVGAIQQCPTPGVDTRIPSSS